MPRKEQSKKVKVKIHAEENNGTKQEIKRRNPFNAGK
jgi:hypothetical protein